MAYPASTKTLAQWVEDIDRQANMVKRAAQQQSTESSAGTLNMDLVRYFFDLLVTTNTFFGTANAVTGLAEYMNTEKQGQVADPVAEFQAMQVAVVSTLDWLRANVPQGSFGGTDYKLAFAFPAGNLTIATPLKFTAAQTAGYRTTLTALMATIS